MADKNCKGGKCGDMALERAGGEKPMPYIQRAKHTFAANITGRGAMPETKNYNKYLTEAEKAEYRPKK